MMVMILYSYLARQKCEQLPASPQIWGRFGFWLMDPRKFGPLQGTHHSPTSAWNWDFSFCNSPLQFHICICQNTLVEEVLSRMFKILMLPAQTLD